MTVHITMNFRVLFPSNPWGGVNEYRYIATKEVELLEIPKRGQCLVDGPLKFQLYGVSPSLSGPAYVCEADYGYSHGWNDMCGIPGYYGLERDLRWFTQCQRLGWNMVCKNPDQPIAGGHERYPDCAKLDQAYRDRRIGPFLLVTQ